ncbi:hypothetical protein VNO77_33242 [Canavalia gladiata]|uniref:Protein-S-isoprenylcysteine O-methyltransferase n=1 Tax=Canavalia gladiata TaxID=3824 RepID=A0AAN9KC06_CANGL
MRYGLGVGYLVGLWIIAITPSTNQTPFRYSKVGTCLTCNSEFRQPSLSVAYQLTSELTGLENKTYLLLCLAKMTEILSPTACRQLSQMFLAITFFHTSEFVLAIVIHGRSSVTLKSLLISRHYLFAMIFSVLEYFIEISLLPEVKEHWVISDLGLTMIVIGEIIRKIAIITAGKAFTHLIRIYHDEHHQLITHGIYRYVRHPSYCGFFFWSVGTQIMLCNPISTIAFAFVVWRFFANRIPYEEFFLRQFFGAQYVEYAQRVGSGCLLSVSGYANLSFRGSWSGADCCRLYLEHLACLLILALQQFWDAEAC